jgi:hypothetical protein
MRPTTPLNLTWYPMSDPTLIMPRNLNLNLYFAGGGPR